MKRGSVVVATAAGFGRKPRPFVVIQSAQYLDLRTLILIPLTTRLIDPPSIFRPAIRPDSGNGLLRVSEAMTNLPIVVRPEKIHQDIGVLSDRDVARIESALAHILGFAS